VTAPWSPDLPERALDYAERGIPVLPLHGKLPRVPAAHTPGDPLYGQCKGECGREGHGVHDATTDPDQVRAWWRRWSQTNIGLRTGVRFDVIDVDGPQGRDSLQRFLAEHAEGVPIGGPRVRTGSGAGWHLYVAPTGLPDRIGVLEGVDYRAADRYVVAPPSRHAHTGRPYVWYAGRGLDTPLGEVPPALRERLTPRPAERQQAPAPTRPAEPRHPTAARSWPPRRPASPVPAGRARAGVASATRCCGRPPATSTTWSPAASWTKPRLPASWSAPPPRAGCSRTSPAKPAARSPRPARSASPTPAASQSGQPALPAAGTALTQMLRTTRRSTPTATPTAPGSAERATTERR